MRITEVEDKNTDSKILNLLLWIFLLSLLVIPGYFFYYNFLLEDSTQEIEEEAETSDTDVITEQDTSETYSEDAVDGEIFFEKFPILDDQQTYVAIPMQVDTQIPPAIVIYNHGDLEELTDSVSTDFMEKLRSYAEVFASNNYVFAASYIHDNDSPSDVSLDDINSLIEWIQKDYTVSTDIYLIGFSRGGYTTTNYVLEYSENIRKVALLAPATYYTEWAEEEVNTVMDIPIKIWHGTADVNIGIVHSEYFVERIEEYGKTVEISKKEGETHYDVDDEYIDEILEFFDSTLQ